MYCSHTTTGCIRDTCFHQLENWTRNRKLPAILAFGISENIEDLVSDCHPESQTGNRHWLEKLLEKWKNVFCSPGFQRCTTEKGVTFCGLQRPSLGL